MTLSKFATVQSTADPLQHTVKFDESDRLIWRKILNYRYFEDLGSRDYFDVVWTDYNAKLHVVEV